MEDRLVRCMMRRDLSTFKQMLRMLTPAQVNECYVNYNTAEKGTLLEFAVEENLPDFVSEVLDAGALPDIFTPIKGCRAIHEAAEKGYVECLRLLLSRGADVNAKASASGRTALHELLSGWSEDLSSQFRSGFVELINHPRIDLNIEDDDECTPLKIAVSNRLDFAVRRLVDMGVTVNEETRRSLQRAYPDLPLPDPSQSNNNTLITEVELSSQLAKAVRNNNVDQCRNLLSQAQVLNIPLDINKCTSDGPTYLQIACEAGYPSVVELLLNHGANIETASPALNKKPLLLACIIGSYKVLQLLLEKRASVNDKCAATAQTIVHEVALQLRRNPRKYLACLQIVLAYQAEDFNVNAQDHIGNTALHYAVLSGSQEAVLLFLRNGADISIRNDFGISPLNRIHPQILEAYLDECVKGNGLSSAASDFVLSFDYSFLSAPHQNDPQEPQEFETTIFPEFPKLSKKSEIEILREIASTKRLQPLLRHPVIRSFVAYKWFKISWAFWLNCVLFFAMILLLTGYVVLLKEESRAKNSSFIPSDPENLVPDGTNMVVRVVLGTALAVFAGALLIRELFQMSIDMERYLRSFENYVEVTLIGSTIGMLATSDRLDFTVNFAAVAIILAWLELLLLLGRYPELSTYITAFVTVSKTFLIMLLGYSLLIFGFALSFYVLGVFDKETDVTAAQGISRSVLKCYVMMTGELDYGGLNFEDKPWISKGVFMFFVFLVTIILLNLLNALAVSDTQIIKNKAEIVIYASHIEMISYFESMFLRRPFPYLRRKFDTFRAIFDKCFLPIKQILNPDKVLVFDRCLPDKKFRVYPNASPESKLKDDVLCCKCHIGYRIDQEVLSEALEIFTKSEKEQ